MAICVLQTPPPIQSFAGQPWSLDRTEDKKDAWMNSLATKIKAQWFTIMGDWSQQLLKLNFQKEKKEDGSTSYTLITGHRREYYWTKITVKQVGSPTPDAWQVTCARSEIRIGLWKIHNTTQDISVVVHTSAQKMIEDINYQTSLKPSFLSKISNWSHPRLNWSKRTQWSHSFQIGKILQNTNQFVLRLGITLVKHNERMPVDPWTSQTQTWGQLSIQTRSIKPSAKLISATLKAKSLNTYGISGSSMNSAWRRRCRCHLSHQLYIDYARHVKRLAINFPINSKRSWLGQKSKAMTTSLGREI